MPRDYAEYYLDACMGLDVLYEIAPRSEEARQVLRDVADRLINGASRHAGTSGYSGYSEGRKTTDT